MLKRILVLGVIVVCVSMLPSLSHGQDLKLGVLANRGALQAEREWKATGDYLSAQVGKAVAIVPLTYEQISEWTKDGKLDFLCTNSAMFAEMNKLYGVQAIATILNQYKQTQVDQFASTIIVKKDSPIKELRDLKGIEFGTASKSAFGGWLMTERLLVESGMKPREDLKLQELHTHDNVIYAVMNGAVAAGSVRSGSVEKMLAEGKIKPDDFRIIHPLEDGFPLLHSTQPYPEYPMAALSHVPMNLREQVAQALVSMSSSEQAAKNLKIAGWKKPLDYSPVVQCLTAIKYGAFGK
jgi:two-component system, LuxR family, sensor histidine kinase TtrS